MKGEPRLTTVVHVEKLQAFVNSRSNKGAGINTVLENRPGIDDFKRWAKHGTPNWHGPNGVKKNGNIR